MLWIGPPTCKKKCLYRSSGSPSSRKGAAIRASSSGEITFSESVELEMLIGVRRRQTSSPKREDDSSVVM